MYIICQIDDTCKYQHVMNVVDYSSNFPRNKPTMHYCTQQLTNKPYVVVEETGIWLTTRYI